jgi:prevent-host-death family protein
VVFKDHYLSIKFSEDLVPLTDLKVSPGRVVKQTIEVHRLVLPISRGRGVALVQSVADYEEAEEEREFMRAVVAGLADLEADREVPLDEARKRLNLK